MARDGELEGLLREGIACFERGDYRDARERFTQVRLKRPGDRRALFWLGASHYHLGNLDEARKFLTSAAWDGAPVLHDRPAAVHEYLCRCELGADGKKAAAHGEEGIRVDPRDPRVRFFAGSAYQRLGNKKMALAYYDAAWRMEGGREGRPAFPELPGQIAFARSSVHVELGQWDEALEAIEDAIARAPENALYHNRRAHILCDGFEQLGPAIEAVRRAIELDPETVQSGSDGLYYHDLALFQRRMQRFDEALEAIERAHAICALRKYKDLREELVALAQGESPARRRGGVDSGRIDFSRVGGLEAVKEQVRRIIRVTHTNRAEAQRYGISKNGILLHGPPGCGKSFFAEAMAGEFGLHLHRVTLTSTQSRFAGGAAEQVERVFQEARAELPCLLFFDEFDALAGKRDEAAGAQESQTLHAILQQIELARGVPGLVIAAATSRLDELDPAVVRPGRFDYKVRLQKPDLEARGEILRILLDGRPTSGELALERLAFELEGLSTAQIKAVVDEAALSAMEACSAIGAEHLEGALYAHIATHRYGGKPVGWEEVVLSADTKRRLQFIQKFLEHPDLVQELGVDPPTGVLLHGPPGTGKTTIARVLASETKASFFSIKAPDIFSKWMGESEQKVKELFEQARENAPAIVFIDEIDAVLSMRSEAGSIGGRAYNSVTNTFLAEMDGIDTHGRVLVIGATNRPELIDEAVLRTGRLSEVIEIDLPDAEARHKLLELFSARMRIAPGVQLASLAQRTNGASGADLKGLCTSAGRNAFLRELRIGGSQPAVLSADFEDALTNLFPGGAWRAARRSIGFVA